MIRHEGDKWVLYTRDGSRALGTHSTPEQARAQENAIMVSKHNKAAALGVSVLQDILRQEKTGGILGQMLAKVIDTPRPHPAIQMTQPSMEATSPFKTPDPASIAAQVRLRSKTSALEGVIPHFLSSLERITS